MRAYWRLCLAAVCLPAVIGVVTATEDQETPPGQTPDCCRELLDRIERLEKRVRELEMRTPQLYTVPKPPPGRPPLDRPDQLPRVPLQPPKDLPPGAEEREFNGMKYYIIPLDRPEKSFGTPR